MNEYIRHVSSGLFACPPGVTGSGRLLGKRTFRRRPLPGKIDPGGTGFEGTVQYWTA